VARTNAKYAELFPFDVSLFDGVGSRAIPLSCETEISVPWQAPFLRVCCLTLFDNRARLYRNMPVNHAVAQAPSASRQRQKLAEPCIGVPWFRGLV